MTGRGRITAAGRRPWTWRADRGHGRSVIAGEVSERASRTQREAEAC